MAKASSKKQKKIISDHNFESINKKIEVVDDDNKIPITKGGKRKRRCVPRDSPSQRSSIYRGVTRHRWTGRYEAHLWDKNCWNDSQKKKGRQVYLGAYDDEGAAARAYDLAALKYWGNETILNFSLSTYEDEMKEMQGLSREEYIGSLRRKSSGFSRGVSKYRGVARHHHNGRWEARIGRVFGNKYLYLGTYATQEEAATAYDIAAIEYRGLNAVTNFDLSRYVNLVKPNESCEDQPSPSNVEATKSIDSGSASTSSSSITTTTTFLEENIDEQIHDQVGHAINIDDVMWSELPSADDCLSTLLGPNECNLLQFDSAKNDRRRYGEGEGSCSNDVRNNDDDFFSDLSSFLCDFDVLVDEQVDV